MREAKHGGAKGLDSGKRRRRNRRLIISLAVVIALLATIGTAGGLLWAEYGERISLALGWTSNDYEGAGHGEVVVTITAGEIGQDVANTLEEDGVVKTADAFYKLLLTQEPAVEFQPGSYMLRQEMSAQAALDALRDPENRVELKATIPEGMAAMDGLQRIADVTGIPMSDFEAAVEDPTAYGVPDEFPSIEGFLFPATYEFSPDDTAESVVQKLVDRMFQALEQHGVAVEDSWQVLTLASIVQREAGSNPDDFPKVSRVFVNRLDTGMKLQSDATVTYGTGNTHTVWTSAEERADTSNKYNTYAHTGLPIGPIGLPGDIAIEAAVHPADGNWLFFVTVNLETGETAFSNTAAEHEQAVQQLADWCRSHRDEGGARCD